jgi:hypothetical protein
LVDEFIFFTIEPFRTQISTHLIKTISEERAELKVKGPQSENDK